MKGCPKFGVQHYTPKYTPKWHQYLPKEKSGNPIILLLAQAYKAVQNLFIIFDKSSFYLKSHKKESQNKKDKNRY